MRKFIFTVLFLLPISFGSHAQSDLPSFLVGEPGAKIGTTGTMGHLIAAVRMGWRAVPYMPPCYGEYCTGGFGGHYCLLPANRPIPGGSSCPDGVTVHMGMPVFQYIPPDLVAVFGHQDAGTIGRLETVEGRSHSNTNISLHLAAKLDLQNIEILALKKEIERLNKCISSPDIC